jgi:aminoglycoside 3-N-acetyltransferase
MRPRTGYPHRPHFGGRVFARALAVADGVLPCPCERKPAGCLLGDSAVLGVQEYEGSVSLEQTTGPSYHTSLDTPDRTVDPAMLRWSGAAATSYLYLLTRLTNVQLAEIGDGVRADALARLAGNTVADRQAAARGAVELEALARAAVPPPLFGAWTTPAQVYAAGVNRRTGRWPEYAALERMRETAADVAAAVGRPAPGADSDARREASEMVPLALFRGALSFEDQWTPAARERVETELAVKVGWGTDNWVWRLGNCFRGRRTLAEIVDELTALGAGVDLAQAVRLTRLLVSLGRVRLRPILDAAGLGKALAQIGVRRGSVLMVHAGLSRFGYMRGGSAAVIAALREALGPEGTLAMPAHSVAVLGASPYNPRTSPSTVGAVTEHFRRQPGVLRSAHPTHSVCALGPAAQDLLAGHRADGAALSREGFWGKLYDLNGDVLLLCPIRSATIFHVGETWTGVPQAPLVVHTESDNGRRRAFTIPSAPWHVDHFEPLLAAPLLASGALRQMQFGEAPLYLGSARAMIDISVEANRRDPACSLGKQGACACWYCRALKANLAAAAK